MTQGRPKTPSKLNDLRGNPGKRPRQSATLPPSAGKLGIVGHLSMQVHRHCSELAKYISNAGAPIALVRPLFDRYCKHLQVAHDSYNILKRKKLRPDEDAALFLAKLPGAQKMFKEHSEMALKIEKQFESIIKSSSPKKEISDPLGDFLKKGGGKPYAVK